MRVVNSGSPDVYIKTRSRSKVVAAGEDQVTLSMVAEELVVECSEMRICSKDEEKQQDISLCVIIMLEERYYASYCSSKNIHAQEGSISKDNSK